MKMKAWEHHEERHITPKTYFISGKSRGLVSLKIISVAIKNYKSLKEINIPRVQDLLVFVGKNSSGKSNLIEAFSLFFHEPKLVTEVLTFNEFMWFNAQINNPIEIEVLFKAEPEELEQIIPETIPENVRSRFGEKISVRRCASVKPEKTGFILKMDEIRCGDVQLVRNGEVVPIEGITPDVPQKIVENILSRLTGVFKVIPVGRNRLTELRASGVRDSIIDDATFKALVALGYSRASGDMTQWSRLSSRFTMLAPTRNQIRVAGSDVIVDSRGFGVSASLEGGGLQEALSLLFKIELSGETIIAIEEPETHMHPELVRVFFRELKRISDRKQIFITSHSPFLVNKTSLDSLWHIWREGLKTRMEPILREPDVQRMLWDLGVRPSDVLFANAIILVEGGTEENILPIMSEKLRGYSFTELNVQVKSMSGASKTTYYIEPWFKLLLPKIPVFILLDGDTKGMESKILTQALPEYKDEIRNNIVILQEATIEEYYPQEALIKGLETLLKRHKDFFTAQPEFKITIKEEFTAFKKESKDEKIINVVKEFLRERLPKERKGEIDKSNWWKVELGKIVAIDMNERDVPREIRDLCLKVRDAVEKY